MSDNYNPYQPTNPQMPTTSAGWTGNAPQQTPTPQQPPAPQQTGYGQPAFGQPDYGVSGYGQAGYGYQDANYQATYGSTHTNFTWANAKPGIVPIRPLQLGDIFSGAVSLLRYNPKTILGLTAIISGLGALGGIFFTVTTGSLLNLNNLGPEISELPTGIISGLGSTNYLSALFLALLTGPLAVATLAAVRGQKPSISQLWQMVKPNFGKFILTSILISFIYVLLLVIGSIVVFGITFILFGGSVQENNAFSVILMLFLFVILLLIPLYLAISIKLLFATPATIIQGLSPFSAISYSWNLSKGYFWRLLGMSLLFTLTLSATTGMLALPLSVVLNIPAFFFMAEPSTVLIFTLVAGILASSIIQIITTPLTAGFNTLLYVDMRIRKEGYDIELLSSGQLG